MKNVKVLDCTLRDGGRIINCAFPDKEIKEISDRLADAKIDIIEVGFLRDWRNVDYKGDSTFFTDVEQIRPFVDKSKKNTMYVAFVDYGMFDFDTLKPCDGTSIDGIRVGFTKKNFNTALEDIVRCLGIIKERGYKLFIQGVNSLGYSDKELLELIELVNKIKPQGFGIVDTYGAMYIDDVDRIYNLVDHNMDSEIWIDFHSHNNFQLSFAFAQEIIKLSRGTRQIVIDATLNGMGKCAGNLNTELIVDYLVRKMNYDYEFDNILDIIDEYMYNYKKNEFWGYSIPSFMAGIYKSHPNNVIYLTEKFRMDTKDIKNMMSMIDEETRQRYDYDNIERLYVEYIADKTDDYEAIARLKREMRDKEILVLIPGSSLNEYSGSIREYAQTNKPVIISVNFCSEYEDGYAFYGNAKRYKNNRIRNDRTIITSNIKSDNEADTIVNYHGLINRGYKYFENSAIMLLNLLKRIEVSKITIAGFDGFSKEVKTNYMDGSFSDSRYTDDYDLMNREIFNMFSDIVKTLKGKCEVDMITPSIYEKALN